MRCCRLPACMVQIILQAGRWGQQPAAPECRRCRGLHCRLGLIHFEAQPGQHSLVTEAEVALAPGLLHVAQAGQLLAAAQQRQQQRGRGGGCHAADMREGKVDHIRKWEAESRELPFEIVQLFTNAGEAPSRQACKAAFARAALPQPPTHLPQDLLNVLEYVLLLPRPLQQRQHDEQGVDGGGQVHAAICRQGSVRHGWAGQRQSMSSVREQTHGAHSPALVSWYPENGHRSRPPAPRRCASAPPEPLRLALTLRHSVCDEPRAVLLLEPIDLLQAAPCQQVAGGLACARGGAAGCAAGWAGRQLGHEARRWLSWKHDGRVQNSGVPTCAGVWQRDEFLLRGPLPRQACRVGGQSARQVGGEQAAEVAAGARRRSATGGTHPYHTHPCRPAPAGLPV